MHRLWLTFDIEDFINPSEIGALQVILELLRKYGLRGLFFITGHMAEKLCDFPKVVNLLKNHEIGFHSSGHSVRPVIPEYADVKNYHQAYSISRQRETAHIDPLTGKIEGDGGIILLQDLFRPKKIEAYRAPGMSWTPPHLEALLDLGVKFDFSSNITNSAPVSYRGVTFYPNTFIQHWDGNPPDYRRLSYAILKRRVAVFDLHPSAVVNHEMWDSIFYRGNPSKLFRIHEKPLKEINVRFRRFELLLKQVSLLRKSQLLDLEPSLEKSSRDLIMSKGDMEKCYLESITWSKRFFGYTPKFIHSHFNEFFETALHG